MSAGRQVGPQRPRAGWLAGRTLSTRLIAGVLLLLVGACAVIGLVTYLAIRGSMVSALDGQLRSASGTYAACIETYHQGTAGQAGDPDRPAGGRGDDAPPPNSDPCSQGQPQGMLGIRIKDGDITNCGVVNGMNSEACRLSATETTAIMALPVYQPPPHQPPPWPSAARSMNLAFAEEGYRVTAIRGGDNDILITGLPTGAVESTLRQVGVAELGVFGCVLVLAGVLGTALVRLSLRPLRRVAATASRVAELPLESGEVSLPPGVPASGPRTEVGQVGAAFNRMLLHVERALSRRAASEARLRRFAADASHELRTPLSAIRGYAELALRHQGPVPGDVTHALRRVQSESVRMGVLVDDLLLLARLDAGRPLEREPVDLCRLAIETISDARVARGDHRWQLDLPDEPVLVEGDEHRLHQVMANVLSNAGKHTPPGSTVRVTLAARGSEPAPARDRGPGEARGPGDAAPENAAPGHAAPGHAAPGHAAPGDAAPGHAAASGQTVVQRGALPEGPRVELNITDDGPGIPAGLLPELFERFTRADTGRAREAGAAGKSTGLGLAIVDAVVAAHGGCITVTSRPGRTRFTIILPLLREPAGQPQASAV